MRSPFDRRQAATLAPQNLGRPVNFGRCMNASGSFNDVLPSISNHMTVLGTSSINALSIACISQVDDEPPTHPAGRHCEAEFSADIPTATWLRDMRQVDGNPRLPFRAAVKCWPGFLPSAFTRLYSGTNGSRSEFSILSRYLGRYSILCMV